MNIGRAAELSGVSAKLIRYYEQIGLLDAAGRTANNYRSFDERTVGELIFIRRARAVGCSVVQIAELLGLWRDRGRLLADVAAAADANRREVEARIVELQAFVATLRDLAEACARGDHPEHPGLGEAGEAPDG
jgi:DNA-binding transcriptional MerR regulator